MQEVSLFISIFGAIVLLIWECPIQLRLLLRCRTIVDELWHKSQHKTFTHEYNTIYGYILEAHMNVSIIS